MTIENMEDFRALDPFFRVIEEGLAGLADGGHFFDLLAETAASTCGCTEPTTRPSRWSTRRKDTRSRPGGRTATSTSR